MKRKIEDLYRRHSKNLRRAFYFLFIYTFIKSLVYFAPLGISYIQDVNQYGKFEYALSLGQTMSGVFSMGFPSAYAYFILKDQKSHIKPLFHFHFLILSGLLLVGLICVPSLIESLYFDSLVIGLCIANQLLAATVYKLDGKNIMAIIVDSCIYFIMALLALLAYYRLFIFSNFYWYASLVVFLILFTICYSYPKSKDVFKIEKKDVISVYKYGLLIVIATPLLSFLSNSTRIFIGYMMSYDEVGIYSFYFRLASFIIIFHRVIGILFFRKLYLSKHDIIDKFYAFFIGVMFLFNVALFFLIPIFVQGRNKLFDNTYSSNKYLFLLAIFQVSFWLSVSLFESLMHREYLTREFIITLLISLLLFIASLYLINYYGYISLPTIVGLNSFFIFLANLFQIGILRRNGFRYKHTLTVQVAIGIVFFTTVLIYK